VPGHFHRNPLGRNAFGEIWCGVRYPKGPKQKSGAMSETVNLQALRPF